MPETQETTRATPPRPERHAARIRRNRLLVLLAGGGLVCAVLWLLHGPLTSPRPGQTLATLSTPAPPGGPVSPFQDEFRSTANGWKLGKAETGGGQATIVDNALEVTQESPQLVYVVPIPRAQPFTDFTLTVSATQQGGDQKDAVVLVFRQSPDYQNEYYLALYPDKRYALARIVRGTATALLPLRTNPALASAGQVNQIRLEVHGPHLRLLVNSVELVRIEDGTLSSGFISLGSAHDTSHPAGTAVFRHLRVTEVGPG